jgi:hypothetical protein
VPRTDTIVLVGLTIAIVVDQVITDFGALGAARRVVIVAIGTARAMLVSLAVTIVVSKQMTATSTLLVALVDRAGVAIVTTGAFGRDATPVRIATLQSVTKDAVVARSPIGRMCAVTFY